MLSVGLNSARSGLEEASRHIQVVSANTSNVGNAEASKKVYLGPSGASGAPAASIVRAGTDSLRDASWTAVSAQAGAAVTTQKLSELRSVFGEGDTSLDAKVDALTAGLRLYAAGPEDDARARSVVATGRDIVTAVNRGSDQLTATDAAISTELTQLVNRTNEHLTRLADIDRRIVLASATGADTTDMFDSRDALIGALAQDVEITVLRNTDASVSLHLKSGATLYDHTPRTVTLALNQPVTSTSRSIPVIDGIPHQDAAKLGGRLGALVGVRDDVVSSMGAQLDEFGAILIRSFAEQSVNPATGDPDRPGLFADPTTNTVPTPGMRERGVAGRMSINPAYDPTGNGSPRLLRDGGSAGPGYVDNVGGYSGFPNRIEALLSRLETENAVDPAATLGPSASAQVLARSAELRLAEAEKTAGDTTVHATALVTQTSNALAREAGIDLDAQLTQMLVLERAYQANARLLSVIDELHQSLLAAAA